MESSTRVGSVAPLGNQERVEYYRNDSLKYCRHEEEKKERRKSRGGWTAFYTRLGRFWNFSLSLAKVDTEEEKKWLPGENFVSRLFLLFCCLLRSDRLVVIAGRGCGCGCRPRPTSIVRPQPTAYRCGMQSSCARMHNRSLTFVFVLKPALQGPLDQPWSNPTSRPSPHAYYVYEFSRNLVRMGMGTVRFSEPWSRAKGFRCRPRCPSPD
ncbi:hypothetical protein LZ30DRAFT_42737 [Colletotrichum cereale]|nr:hypothetical protein LZ30DRAFT_42737 [Colletotrichum cereale]